eukprot:scaffold7956_cov65-Phaeocystis_antarctica.AAC.1
MKRRFALLRPADPRPSARMPRLASFLWATVFACLLTCSEACEIISANVADGYGEDATIDGNCITITPGCNDLGGDAFRSSSVNTVTVEYKASTLMFNNNALRDLSGTVTVIRSTTSPDSPSPQPTHPSPTLS